jgi:flagellar motor switch protein FliG
MSVQTSTPGSSKGREFAERGKSARHADERAGPRGLSPLRKAALIIVSLDESLAQELVSHLDRADIDALNLELTQLEYIDPEEQRAALEEFVELGVARHRQIFDDVVQLDASVIRAAYRQEDQSIWALALAGASRISRQRVFDALHPQVAELLRRALTALGPFRLDDVETAQQVLGEKLREISESGNRNVRSEGAASGVLA